MTTHVTTHNPVRSDVVPGPRAVRPSRTWALAGVGAGLAGIGVIVSTGMVNAVYDEKLAGDTPAIADRLADQTTPMLVFHTCAMVGAVLTIVFAAGLHRRLRSTLGDASIAPLVAFSGLLGTAVVTVLGSGLDTEFIFGLMDDDAVIDPVNAVFYNHWIGTIPWIWGLAGLSGLAVFAAARAAGVPRWIGYVGLVLGGLTLLLGISPLQYMAGMTGPLWLVVTAAGFALGDRAFRS
jgi:hypothetical protein